MPFVRPPGVVKATVCVPSGIIYKPGMSCPTVTGDFALDALAKQNPNWWGGQQVSGVVPANSNAIPGDINGWKRYLADEYIRSFHGAAPAQPAVRNTSPAPAPPQRPPAAAPPAPPAPPPAAPRPAPRGRGRG